MAGLKERIVTRVSAIRSRYAGVDHLVRMIQHYIAVKGNVQAGAVTFFAFLSFFPILALSFVLIGFVAKVYPNAEADLVRAIEQVLPGLVGNGAGEISLDQVQDAAGAIGLVGLLGVVYAGLGWLSGMREALLVVFDMAQRQQPNFVLGKLRDLVTLLLVGIVLIASVAVSSFVSGFSGTILGLLGLDEELAPLLALLTVVVGLAANMVLFFALFRLLAHPPLPRSALWSGAILGAAGFEVLKRLAGLLLESTRSQPAFQAFGVALILVVWINYFSRVVLLAGAWAYTSRVAREAPQNRPPMPGAAVVLADPASASYDAPPAVAPTPTPARNHATKVESGKSARPAAVVAGGMGAGVIGALLVRRRRRRNSR